MIRCHQSLNVFGAWEPRQSLCFLCVVFCCFHLCCESLCSWRQSESIKSSHFVDKIFELFFHKCCFPLFDKAQRAEISCVIHARKADFRRAKQSTSHARHHARESYWQITQGNHARKSCRVITLCKSRHGIYSLSPKNHRNTRLPLLVTASLSRSLSLLSYSILTPCE